MCLKMSFSISLSHSVPNGSKWIIAMSNIVVFSLSFQAAEAKLGGIDYLVLNHILNIDMGEWQGSSLNLTLLQSILDVNFNAYVHLASPCVASIREKRWQYYYYVFFGR